MWFKWRLPCPSLPDSVKLISAYAGEINFLLVPVTLCGQASFELCLRDGYNRKSDAKNVVDEYDSGEL